MIGPMLNSWWITVVWGRASDLKRSCATLVEVRRHILVLQIKKPINTKVSHKVSQDIETMNECDFCIRGIYRQAISDQHDDASIVCPKWFEGSPPVEYLKHNDRLLGLQLWTKVWEALTFYESAWLGQFLHRCKWVKCNASQYVDFVFKNCEK